METTNRTNDPAANPDPITKAPGAHPAGTGVGAAAGGAAGIGGAIAAGAALGTAAGPVGTAIGATVGAVVGGLIGKGVAESINPTAEHEYWQKNYASRPYVKRGSVYSQYGPAYQHGWESRGRFADKRFDDVEADIGRGWEDARRTSSLKWEDAKQAVRDGWDRVTPD